MNSEIELEEIILKIIDSKKIVILTHESPDGDAIGSCLAMYLGLKQLDKEVSVVCDEYSVAFNFLEDTNIILNDTKKKYDLCICLDCANKSRLYDPSSVFDKCDYTVCIDHHVSNTYFADSNYVDGKSPANCQILIKLFKKLGISIDNKIGECLMTGIITDTGGFQNSDINSDTFRFIADMIDTGVDVSDISFRVFMSKTKSQFLLSNIANSRLEFFNKNRVAFTYILISDEKEVNALIGDHEGIVNIGRNIEGVEVSIFLREVEGGFKVSLRSNRYVDVSEVSKVFDGGGHVRASGCFISDSLENVKSMLLKEINKRL